MRISLFLLGLLSASAALAEPDTFGLGTGRNGVLLVDQPDTTINRAGQLTTAAAAGTKVLTIGNASSFTAGELVLIQQYTGLSPAPASGDQRAINLGSSPVGRFEYARVELVAETSLQLTAPLQYSYGARMAQVVNVPEYTDVQVLAGASLKAVSWNGSVGGILALLATGTLTNDGLISADGAGFRGGAFINNQGGEGCTSLDEVAGVGGSYKGEGPVSGRFGTAAGRGNLAIGGGGGNCHNAGGGGGGHFGLGGKGGFSPGQAPQPDDVGGLGGAPLVYIPYERLLFGGGGGGGAGHTSIGTPGAAGGGVVILRVGDVAGTGRFSASGASANFVASVGDDGAGGGGAGGALSVRAARALRCGQAQAAGGSGGDTRHVTSESGPGGGGGGGVVFLQAQTLECPISVVAGQPGQSTAAGGTYGAGPSVINSGPSYGFEQTFQVPFRVPTTPVLTEPANGATGVLQRPRISGTADPGVIVQLYLDGVPYVRVVPDGSGAFSYTPSTDLPGGAHELRASAEEFGVHSPQSTANRFDVVSPVPDGGVPAPSKDGGVDGGASVDGPVLVEPLEGASVVPLVLFAGTSRTGDSIGIEVDGSEVARVPLDDQRRFRYTLTAEQKLAPGTHSVIARAWNEAGKVGLSSPVTTFEVRAPDALEVGCGCGASPGAGIGIAALLLGLGAARLRRRD